VFLALLSAACRTESLAACVARHMDYRKEAISGPKIDQVWKWHLPLIKRCRLPLMLNSKLCRLPLMLNNKLCHPLLMLNSKLWHREFSLCPRFGR
jgi:hypothetical protein